MRTGRSSGNDAGRPSGFRPWSGSRISFLLVALGLVIGSGATANAHEVRAPAAISLEEAAGELGRQFQQAHPGVTVRFNFGTSDDLQTHIEAAAPVDGFLSAGQRQMDALEKQGLLLAGSQRRVARNAMPLIAPDGSQLQSQGVADLKRPAAQRVVPGNPKPAPAGPYAEQRLRALGWWDLLQPEFLFAENLRHTRKRVARGEVDAGFVDTTDLPSRPGALKEAARPAQVVAPSATPGR